MRILLGRGAAGQGDDQTGRAGGHQAETVHCGSKVEFPPFAVCCDRLSHEDFVI
jgi:hypothetical protein